MKRMRWMIVALFALIALGIGCKEEPPPVAGPGPIQPNPPNAGGHPNPSMHTESVPTLEPEQAPAVEPIAQGAPDETGQQNKLTGVVAGKFPGSDQPLMSGDQVLMPEICWGGDMPTNVCAGGSDGTHQGTECAEYNVNIRLTKGDDFSTQLANYRARRSPFLRGTMSMIGKHWSTLCREDVELCPQMFFVLTKSKGDYLVCREHVKVINDLLACKTKDGQPRKCKIALQKDGPWDTFVAQTIEEEAKHTDGTPGKWTDVELVWMKNLSGPDSAAFAFEKDLSIDCAMMITPDKMAMTAGSESPVPGAHELYSTAMRRDAGIIDFYVVAPWFAKANAQWLHSFVAAYEKSSELLARLSAKYIQNDGDVEYEQIMTAMVGVYPEELKNSMDEAHGLYLDADFVGIGGNIWFFDPTNEFGVKYHQKWANRIARLEGTATEDVEFGNSVIDWSHSVFNDLASRKTRKVANFRTEATLEEINRLEMTGGIGSKSTIRITANFAVDKDEIKDCSVYNEGFDTLLSAAERNPFAPIMCLGHIDSTHIVATTINAACAANLIKKVGSKPGDYRYYKPTKMGDVELDLTKLEPWMDLLKSMKDMPRDSDGNAVTELIQSAEKSSLLRAEALRTCLLNYAKQKGVQLDPARVVAKGMGIRDPLIAKARTEQQLLDNRRAEMTLLMLNPEAVSTSDLEL